MHIFAFSRPSGPSLSIYCPFKPIVKQTFPFLRLSETFKATCDLFTAPFCKFCTLQGFQAYCEVILTIFKAPSADLRQN